VKVVKLVLQVVGGATVFLILVYIALIYRYPVSPEKSMRERVLDILDAGSILPDENFTVLGSYDSDTRIDGAGEGYYCIELTRFVVAEDRKALWREGPEQNPLLARAIRDGLNEARKHHDCFPDAIEVNSELVEIRFRSIDIIASGLAVFYEILLFDTRSMRLYYLSSLPPPS
jgi:hypothetical protein